tara:strand:- start:239 stop:1441 length:1203 start_codon:yes stop_codon:yes gene_type:complete
MEQPNFALIPSGFKTAKVYSVIPESGVGDLTLDRSNNTATRINKDGLIESVLADVPRLNYEVNNGVVDSCPHLLLEMNSTNIVVQSNNFTAGGWNFSNLTVTGSNTTSPEGKINASKLTTSNVSHSLYLDLTVTASTEYTFSFFIKRGTMTDLKYRVNDLSNTANIISPTSYYSQTSNQYWQRISATFTTPSGCTSIRFIPVTSSGVTGTVFIYGCQVEEVNHATSYIPTSGSAQSRASESCTGAGDVNTFNSVEGILYAELKREATLDSGFRRININDGSVANTVRLGYSSTTNEIKAVVTINTSTSISLVFTGLSVTSFRKMALLYKANKFELWVDGNREAQNTTQANTFAPNTLNDLSFQQATGADKLRAKVKDVRYYDTDGMSNTEITNLLTQLTQ